MGNPEQYEVISPDEAAGNSMVELVTKAEIDTQIATAKKYPRSLKQFVHDATEMVTLNQEVAASCNYGLPRGGKIIEGPSVRFAEIIQGAYGNMRSGARVVHEDSRFITAQGVCHDIQRNSMITMEVKRRITDRNGKTFADDMIGVTGNAAASIALRNAILRAVPKAFWDPIYQQARKVAIGEGRPMSTRRADAIATMQVFGVTLEMILAKFEIKGVEDLTIDHLSQLSAARTSIKEGVATAEELFAIAKPADEGKGNSGVKDKLKKSAKAKKAGADPETGELPPDDGGTPAAAELPGEAGDVATQPK